MKKVLLLIIISAIIGDGVLLSQTIKISGTVTSSVEGEGTVAGAAVVVKGTNIGTLTDANGKYTLSVPQNAKSLVFSFIGKKNVEVQIEGKTVIDMIMEPDVLGLQEVVVTALGVSRERNYLFSFRSALFFYPEVASPQRGQPLLSKHNSVTLY